MRWILPIVALLSLTGCEVGDFGPSDRYTAEFHYTLKPSDRLSVENYNGEIEVAGWDEPSIEITGVRYGSTRDVLDEVKIDVHESSAITELRTSKPGTLHGNSGARYMIRAPRKTILDHVQSSNGAVRIRDMASASRVHTSNGAVRVDNVSGDIDAVTSNGAIEIDSVTGKVNLKTSNGRIRAEELDGPCDAETSNGPVSLRFKSAPEGPTRVRTSNGSVELSLLKSPKNSVRVETSNGAITLNLPPDTAARINAETSQSVSSEFDVAHSYSDNNKHKLEGTIGAGGSMIELTTRNGGIHLKKSSAN